MNKLLIFQFVIISCLCSSHGFSQITADALTIRLEQAVSLRKSGENNEAIQVLHQTLSESLTERDSNDRLHAPIYHQLGLNHYLTGRTGTAQHYSSKAVFIRQNDDQEDRINLARSLFLRAAIYRELNKLGPAKHDIKMAISVMEKALDISTDEKNERRLANMYIEYFTINTDLGDFSTALSYWDKAYHYFLKNYGPDYPRIAALYTERALLFGRQRKYKKSIADAKNAIKIYTKNGEQNWQAEIAHNYNNIAFSNLQMKNLSRAERYFNKALENYQELFSTTAHPSFQLEIANIYSNLLATHTQSKNFQQAQQYAQKGRELALALWETNFHPRIAELYRHTGELALAQDRLDEAQEEFQKAMSSLVLNFQSNSPGALPNIKGNTIWNKANLLEVLEKSAEVTAQRYQQTNNWETLERQHFINLKMDTLITQIRQGLSRAGSKYTLMSSVLPIYEQAIDVALQLYERTQTSAYLEEAYHLSAKNKALILLEGLQNEQAKTFGGIPVNLLEQELELKKRNYELNTNIYEQQLKNNTKVVQSIQDSLFQTQRSYTKLVDLFERDYPAYYQLKYEDVEAIQTTELQAKLPNDAAIIEYFVGEKFIYTFVISAQSFEYYKRSKPKDFTTTCIEFRKASDGNSKMANKRYLEIGFQLYEWLLDEPLANLQASLNPSRLIIIPDDILLHIAFDPILYEPSDQWNRLDNPYLIKKYAINYAYSNRLIFDAAAEKRINQAMENFGGFGLEYDDYTLEGIEKLVKSKIDSDLLNRATGKLIYSDDEVREIAELLDGESWLNQEATKDAFLQNASTFRILHMAMHGIVDENNPLNSSLIFTRTSDTSDYFLRAADLYGIPLNADMAVLSACNTGYGAIKRGEGVRSLARAFAYAGCPSLIASLWEASDKSSKDILITFYENLKAGMPKDKALQAAKLDYIENAAPAFSGPAYWSHLALIGDAKSINLEAKPPWYQMLCMLFISALVGLILIRRFKT
jgi:CHAT domain-containing protein/tetratricopeptide (TPR) repeat protein